MFADNIVICGEIKERVEESLDSWNYAKEKKGIKVSRSKVEYVHVVKVPWASC